ncbi:hypothetical protein N9N28_14115 [Rubripirellula amarantea]|uniref:Uncharacterized protein n=1 Tax=Rubripirellula amarantea TaxID=2527999 RepID=A0A5C5WWP5_9BACT|nr:hypothetical protein [Rubripirellula amarantea]MDA8745764.1 hypothetical protein [Rubripirellula amarantea]TWT54561.1 hypothetical protein Pla22_22100 [Rubripirellula amarantea]
MNITNSLTSLSFPLAETHLAEVTQQYREDTSIVDTSIWWFMLIPVAAIAIPIFLHWFVNRTPAIVNTPLGMLHELCKVHRLNKRERLLLESVAEELGMQQPAVLFAEAKIFTDATEQASGKMGFDQKQKTTIAILKRKLFS